MDVTTALAKIGRGPAACEDLDRDEAHLLFKTLLEQHASPVQLGALLMALRWKGETTEELIGFQDALTPVTRSMIPPPSARRVAVIPSYSPHHRQANLMPALALRLARAGVPVIVHGGLGGGEEPPSFAVFAQLGHEVAKSMSEAQDALAMCNLAVVPTHLLSPELARLLELRGELGSRHVGHLLARLLDPVPGRSVRLICSSDAPTLERLGDVLAESGADAILMRATDGESYASPERRPRITWFAGGNAEVLYEEDPFPGAAIWQSLDPADPVAVAGLIQDMLDGRRPTPVPVANQLAACFVATGHARDLSHARAMVAVGYGRSG